MNSSVELVARARRWMELSACLAAFACVVLFAPSSFAMCRFCKITSNLTLTATLFGNVEIDADNVTLDCQNNIIHSSSAAGNNCENGTKKCAISVEGRHFGVKIKNCAIVGGN